MSISLAKRHEENLLLSVEPLAEYLQNDAITDLYINPDGKLFIKGFGEPRRFTETIITADVIKRIINFTASMTGQIINEHQPVLEGILPYFDMRIHAFIPPWVSAPSICIRKKNRKVIPLKQFVDEDRLTMNQYQFLLECIRTRKNIIIAGGTGSGKTTFLNSVINQISELCPTHRLYIVEDTGEIICTAFDYVSVCVEPADTVKAVRSALRYYPDRIIFGELRYGDTANELLKAWKTGHPGGLTTIHAENAGIILSRIRDLIMECITGRITAKMLAEVIHVCVFMQDMGLTGPKITDVIGILIEQNAKQILYSKIN